MDGPTYYIMCDDRSGRFTVLESHMVPAVRSRNKVDHKARKTRGMQHPQVLPVHVQFTVIEGEKKKKK